MHRRCMATKEETQAKSDATRLKNLLARKADKKPFSKLDKAMLKRLKAKAKKRGNPAFKVTEHERPL